MVSTKEVYHLDDNSKETEKIGEVLASPRFEDVVYPFEVGEIMRLILGRLDVEDHNLLFGGVRGCGKTFSARMIACETKRPFVYMSGNMGKNKIIDILLNLKPRSIVLIDEIHGLRDSVAEIIYPAIQDSEIYVDGKRIELDCMFIGTTTEVQKLPPPLLDRFFLIEFDELEEQQLRDIIIKKGCDDASADALLKFTNNFRVLDGLVKMIKMYGSVNLDNTRKIFLIKKIDMDTGLSHVQTGYLKILRKGRLSLRSLSLQLNRSEDYIKSIETDLIRKGMVSVCSRGRELSEDYLVETSLD